MRFSPLFFRIAAVSSVTTVITTLALIFLPEFYRPGSGFEARMVRVEDPAYQLRAWIYLLHPFLVFTAALGVAARLRQFSAGAAVIGALGFMLWAMTEAGQQTLTLFAFDRWREAYLAGDADVIAQMPELARIYDGLWDAMYVLLLLGFAIGNFAFGLAMIRHDGFTRVVGAFFLAAFLLTLTNLLPEVGGPGLPDSLAQWAYPAIQPLGRLLIGIWLWRFAFEDRGLGTAETTPR